VISRIKKNDTVKILSGKDKGKKGLVLAVFPEKNQVLVQGIAIVTKHKKARKQGQHSEIKKTESFISLSKTMLICIACHVPSRVNTKILENGSAVRMCNRCNLVT
jgi:large subunit ribosomal protein L24